MLPGTLGSGSSARAPRGSWRVLNLWCDPDPGFLEVIHGVGGGYACECLVETEYEDATLLYDVSDPGECKRIEAELKAKYEDAVCEAVEKRSLW